MQDVLFYSFPAACHGLGYSDWGATDAAGCRGESGGTIKIRLHVEINSAQR
jgi:hypothetical protein